MAFKNVKITCQPILWQANDVKDVSMFSGHPKIYLPSIIDLKDYMTEDSNEVINYEFEHIKEGNTSDIYFHKASDFSITVSDLKTYDSNKSLYHFFGIFNHNPFIRFLVKIFYDQTVIFQGLIYPDGITYEDPECSDSIDEDSKKIYLDVISLEKDFADYFKNTSLPADTAYTQWENLFRVYQTPTVFEDIYARNIKELFSYIFNGIQIKMPPHIADWKIARDATFRYQPADGAIQEGLYFPAVGYKQIQSEGTSRYDFLEKICNGMGWTFRVKPNEIEINDRAFTNGSIPIYNISASDIIGIASMYNEGAIIRNKYLRITPHIDLVGGDAAFHYNNILKGAHDIIITQDGTKELNGYHFNKVSQVGSFYQLHTTPLNGVILKTLRHREQDDFEAKYLISIYSTPYKDEYFNINKRESLTIDCGRNSKWKRYLDVGSRSMGYYDGTQSLGDNHMVFSGCFASSLFKFQNTPRNYVKYSYSNINTSKSYIHSELFKKNMQAILSSYSKNYIEISFKGIKTDPLHFVQIYGSSNPDLNKTFVPLSVHANIFQDITTYKLIEKENIIVI